MATFTVNDRTALTGAGSAQDDQFLIWDTSAGTHKKMARSDLQAAFLGAGNVATNVALGTSALGSNTTGAVNTAIGYVALGANTTGAGNVAVGNQALTANTVGANNSAVGHQALASNTTGATNVAVGQAALYTNTTGANNVAIGAGALYANTVATECSAVGAGALVANTNGTQNTALGRSAGANLTSGGNNTFLGYNAQPSAAGINNEVTIGNSSVATIRAQVTSITALSDRRFKSEIEPTRFGLALINDVEVVDFTWNGRDPALKGRRQTGVIAQQLLEVERKHKAANLRLVYNSNPKRLEATPGNLLPVMVRAIQELSAEVRALKHAA